MSEGLRAAYDQAVAKAGDLPLRLAVWTTTAWTLPANLVSCRDLFAQHQLMSRESMSAQICSTLSY